MPDPNSILVDPVKMQGLMDAIEQAAKSFNHHLNTLEEVVQKKIDGGWNGEQKSAYYESKAKWDKIVLEMTAHLGLQQTAVRDANQQFGDTDRKAAGRFGGISTR